MSGKKIGVFDSGLGGLSVLRCLTAFFPAESFVYFGDNSSAPYGDMSLRRLRQKAFEGLIFLLSFNVKAVVVACNTLSVNCLSFLKTVSPVPVVGVFPPVEGALMRGEKTLLLSTPKTAEYYGNNPSLYNRLSIYPLRRLAGEIECYAKSSAPFIRPCFAARKTSAEKGKPLAALKPAKRESAAFVCENPPVFSPFDNLKPLCPPRTFDTVILGCTHYFFASENIFEHFCPQKIYGGEIFTCFALNRVLNKMGKNKINRKNIAISKILFVGKCGIINKNFWLKHVKRGIKTDNY